MRDIACGALSALQPILLIIDAGHDPNNTAGQIRLFKEQRPSGRVAVVADHHRPVDIISAFQAGANVYHAKLANFCVFTKALELVMLGETILPSELLSFIGDCKDESKSTPHPAGRVSVRGEPTRSAAGDYPPLTIREKCILRCIVDGDSNKLIARRIGIAEATVKIHVKAILRKTRIHNRTQAAIWAMNNRAVISLTDDSSHAIAPAQAPSLLPAGSAAPLPLSPPMNQTVARE
jgi:two-component system nitrate/nitrite response regulator NarL